MLARKGNYRKAMQRLMSTSFVANDPYTKSEFIALHPGSERVHPYPADNTPALDNVIRRDQTDLAVLNPITRSIPFA
ncbi:hypothetical protein GJ496_009576 [Pomphorhynchus laevis]|nr:hypothetical protein GJ496_009576 [Pomphorhynchus laevis]